MSRMSSRHEGVSCDGCMAPNFTGDRFKCLRCYDFDLCSRCYKEERSGKKRRSKDSDNGHQPTHPMQCIMTQQDFERTYRGDPAHNWERSRVVIFVCPVCGAEGFSRERLLTHIMEEQLSTAAASSSSNNREEMACPICISTDSYRMGFADCVPNHITDMGAHMAEYHSLTSSTPSASTGHSGQSGASGCPEYLRDDDLRRVILSNIPLMGDMEFDESLSESTRRHINALLNANRGGISATSHSRRRMERSNEPSGHEEETHAIPIISRRGHPGIRGNSFGRHWQPPLHRQSAITVSNTVPSRLRQIRSSESESWRNASPSSSSNANLRSFFPRDSSHGTRSGQPSGVLIRPTRRLQQNAADRNAADSVSRQPFSRGASRLTESDRGVSKRYSREAMRSIFEGMRKNEQGLSPKRRIMKTPLSKSEDSVDKGEVLTPASSETERLPSPSTSDVGTTSGRLVASLDESAIHEPVFVEKAGKAMLLLPKNPPQDKTFDSEETLKKPLRHRKSSKNELKKHKDSKAHQIEKESKKKHERNVSGDEHSKWLQSYQPLFLSSAKLAFPLPVIQIGDDENEPIWGDPEPIPDITLEEKKEEIEPSVELKKEKEDVPPPVLPLYIGKAIPCTYNPTSEAALHADKTSVEDAITKEDVAQFRQILDTIKELDETRKVTLDRSLASSLKKKSYAMKREGMRDSSQKQTTSAFKSVGSYNPPKVAEISRVDNVDRYQDAFKAATEDVLLDATAGEKQKSFKPFHVVPEQISKKLIAEWLEQERSQDDNALGLGFGLDEIIKTLMSQIPHFSDDVIREDDVIDFGPEEPMFDPSEGTDNEMLAKKCASCGILQAPPFYYAVGPLTPLWNEKENVENDYWKSPRFLHNRRDAFILRKSIETPPENALDTSDWRFVRQLLFGVRDAPASGFLRRHFFSDTFNVVLECNLRNLIRNRNELTFEEPSTSEESAKDKQPEVTDTSIKMAFEEVPTRIVSDIRLLNVHPALWHFLDLGGFVAE